MPLLLHLIGTPPLIETKAYARLCHWHGRCCIPTLYWLGFGNDAAQCRRSADRRSLCRRCSTARQTGANIEGLLRLIEGYVVADVVAIIGSINCVLEEAD